MVGHMVAAALVAILPLASRGLRKGGDVLSPGGNLHRFRLPEREGIHRSGGPGPARVAVAVPHRLRFARHLDLNRTAKALSFVHCGYSLSGVTCRVPDRGVSHRAGI